MKNDVVDPARYADMFAAMGNEARLRVVRTLLAAHPEGMAAGDIQAELGIPASTLSFHLKEMTHAGLLTQEREGRHLIYRAAFGHMDALLAYLTAHCCQGRGCAATGPGDAAISRGYQRA